MSYCMFHNTSQDLQDCIDKVDEISQNDGKDEDNETLSYTEMQKLDEMIEQARYYAMIAEDFMMMMEDRKQEQENNK